VSEDWKNRGNPGISPRWLRTAEKCRELLAAEPDPSVPPDLWDYWRAVALYRLASSELRSLALSSEEETVRERAVRLAAFLDGRFSWEGEGVWTVRLGEDPFAPQPHGS
jgi:hypothetical protein